MKDPNLVTQYEEENGLEPGSAMPSSGVSFAELTLFVEHIRSLVDGPKKRPGRKPQGEVALTPAQKQKAYRDRKRERLAAIKAGEPVESKLIDLTTDFATVYKEKSKQT